MAASRSAASLASTAQLVAPFRPECLFQEKDLFLAGLDGTHIFRIPALLATAADTLLAFCEARERDDCDPLDLVLKRSVPTAKCLQGVNGVLWPNDRTWLPMQVVVPGAGDAVVNPCALIDRRDGRVWVCCARAVGGLEQNLEAVSGPLLMVCSDDDGASWSVPVDIGGQVGYFLPGPGVGTQLHSGRLVVPGYDQTSSKVIYSDDQGRTWTAGAPAGAKADESQAMELADGVLMLNMRAAGCRRVALSRDGGRTWFEEYRDEALPDPSCMAALIRYSRAADGRSRLLFANPAHPHDRTHLTVRISYDDGRTWPEARVICDGHAAYASLAALADGTIGLLYETGDDHPYERIRFARFSLEWLTEGRDRIRPASLPLELPLVWEFGTGAPDAGAHQEGIRGAGPGQPIRVDAPWTSQGWDYHGVAWYRLPFTVPGDVRQGARLALLFGAIDGYAQVFLDGAPIAAQRVSPRVMGDRPFLAPLPDAVEPDQTCQVAVRVDKGSGRAGLWKPVCLVET